MGSKLSWFCFFAALFVQSHQQYAEICRGNFTFNSQSRNVDCTPRLYNQNQMTEDMCDYETYYTIYQDFDGSKKVTFLIVAALEPENWSADGFWTGIGMNPTRPAMPGSQAFVLTVSKEAVERGQLDKAQGAQYTAIGYAPPRPNYESKAQFMVQMIQNGNIHFNVTIPLSEEEVYGKKCYFLEYPVKGGRALADGSLRMHYENPMVSKEKVCFNNGCGGNTNEGEGWGESETSAEGSGEPETSGEGWGESEPSGEGWGESEPSGEGWGESETSGEGWGESETSGEGWGESETSGESWGESGSWGESWGESGSSGESWGEGGNSEESGQGNEFDMNMFQNLISMIVSLFQSFFG